MLNLSICDKMTWFIFGPSGNQSRCDYWFCKRKCTNRLKKFKIEICLLQTKNLLCHQTRTSRSDVLNIPFWKYDVIPYFICWKNRHDCRLFLMKCLKSSLKKYQQLKFFDWTSNFVFSQASYQHQFWKNLYLLVSKQKNSSHSNQKK